MTHAHAVIFIGLEIHIQLNSRQKIFCTCSTTFGNSPNSNVCPICLGYPGVLPVLNGEALRKGYIVARALDCTLSSRTAFARKNYFYPDLPKNYQISQFDAPLGCEGHIILDDNGQQKHDSRTHTVNLTSPTDSDMPHGAATDSQTNDTAPRTIGITEVHLEEDAGKMIHSGDISLIDFNRTGTPLLEVVTKPDLRSAKEAELLLHQMRQIVRYLNVSNGNMEEGSLRCDANISIALNTAAHPSPPLPNYKVEIKNMNSSRFVRMALEYEIVRQTEILIEGNTPPQETRLWNENRDITSPMRSKEESMDYRYFPEPDLPTFFASPQFLTQVENALVEMPYVRARRIAKEYACSLQDARALCIDKQTADYFERCVAAGAQAQLVHAWIFGEVRKHLNKTGTTIANSVITATRLAQLLTLLHNNDIHIKIAKQVLELVHAEDKDPQQIITEHGWTVLRGEELRTLVQEVLAAHPEVSKRIRNGEHKSIGFLVGQIMKKKRRTGTSARE